MAERMATKAPPPAQGAPVERKKKQKRRRKAKPETEEERLDAEQDAQEEERLQKLLFGRSHPEATNTFGSELQIRSTLATKDIARTKAQGDGSEDEEENASPTRQQTDPDVGSERDQKGASGGRQAAWVDVEDKVVKVNVARVSRLRKLRKEEEEEVLEGHDYIERLRMQHAKLHPSTEWANLQKKAPRSGKKLPLREDEEDEEAVGRLSELDEDDDGLLLGSDEVVVKGSSRLQPGILEVTRVVDANEEEPNKGVVQSVQFHPNGQLLMTAGLDKSLRFFHVDGKRNAKVQGVFLEDMPVHRARFAGNGARVIAAGRRHWYYIYDLEAGRIDRVGGLVGRDELSLETFEVSPGGGDLVAFLGNNGYVLLASQRSRQLVGTLKVNGDVRTAAFTPDNRELITSGSDGQLYHWDLGTRRCIHRAVDDGCLRNTSLAVSPDSRLFATGSDRGVVNLYNRHSFLEGKSEPTKALMNLTTSIDTLAFNHDTQMLAMASRMKKDAMRIVHLPSYTVFSNWPSSRSPIHFVHSLDFSPRGGYLAVGNARGKVLLYRLHQYDSA